MKKKIIFTLIAITILTLTILFLKYSSKAKDDGKVRIIIKNETVIVDEYVDYSKNDTLAGILKERYDAVFRKDKVLISLKGENTDFISNYWAFYINDEYATVGIMGKRLHDGDVYLFEVKEI